MPYRLDQNIREDGILEKMSDILSLFPTTSIWSHTFSYFPLNTVAHGCKKSKMKKQTSIPIKEQKLLAAFNRMAYTQFENDFKMTLDMDFLMNICNL